MHRLAVSVLIDRLLGLVDEAHDRDVRYRVDDRHLHIEWDRLLVAERSDVDDRCLFVLDGLLGRDVVEDRCVHV